MGSHYIFNGQKLSKFLLFHLTTCLNSDHPHRLSIVPHRNVVNRETQSSSMAVWSWIEGVAT